MRILTAIQNKEINEKIKKNKKIEIVNTDIQYKEGIIEYLENDSKIDLIILLENLPGEISVEELINNIKKINNKIKIIILTKKEINKKEEKVKENIKYFYYEKINYELIYNLIKEKTEQKQEKKIKKIIIKITGTNGVGKTVISSIISELLVEKENKKVLLIEETDNKILINIYKKIYDICETKNKEKIIKIKENLFLLNSFKIEDEEIIKENKFDYIIIDSSKIEKSKYEKIVNKKIIIIEPNLIGLEKLKKTNFEEEFIILNKITPNSIYEKLIENILNKKIIEKINHSQNIDLFINNKFNLIYLKKNEIKKFLNIINKIKE